MAGTCVPEGKERREGKGGEAASGENFPFSPSPSMLWVMGLMSVCLSQERKLRLEVVSRGGPSLALEKRSTPISVQLTLGPQVAMCPLEASGSLRNHIEC